MKDATRYLVIRVRKILGYQEYLGPIVSTPREAEADAARLFGLPGHTLTLVPWSKATRFQRERLKRDRADGVQ